jgi:UDP-glucose 4-epimerase
VLVPKSVENPAMDADSILGSINVLQCMRKYGGERIVFPSSGFLYGNTAKFPTPETESIQPVSPYVVSKNAVENYLWFYKHAFNINYIIFRYAAIYGPGQQTGAMADYIRKLSIGKQADIWGDGTKTRDYVFIDDVVRANLLVLELPLDYSNPLFNIGTGKQTTLNDLYNKIAQILNKNPNPTYHEDRVGEQMKYSLDSAKIKDVLNWEPQISLDTGLNKTIEYHLKHQQNLQFL